MCIKIGKRWRFKAAQGTALSFSLSISLNLLVTFSQTILCFILSLIHSSSTNCPLIIVLSNPNTRATLSDSLVYCHHWLEQTFQETTSGWVTGALWIHLVITQTQRSEIIDRAAPTGRQRCAFWTLGWTCPAVFLQSRLEGLKKQSNRKLLLQLTKDVDLKWEVTVLGKG